MHMAMVFLIWSVWTLSLSLSSLSLSRNSFTFMKTIASGVFNSGLTAWDRLNLSPRTCPLAHEANFLRTLEQAEACIEPLQAPAKPRRASVAWLSHPTTRSSSSQPTLFPSALPALSRRGEQRLAASGKPSPTGTGKAWQRGCALGRVRRLHSESAASASRRGLRMARGTKQVAFLPPKSLVDAKLLLATSFLAWGAALMLALSDTGALAAATEWRSQDALVVGRLGGRVELECGAADPALSGNDGDEPSLLLWFHESRPATPLYSVDGRRTGGSGMAGAQHSMSDVWAARAYFSSVSRTLRLEDLAADDQGRYRCRVDFRRGRTRTSTLTLVVREEPHNVTIGDEHGVEMRGTVGPFNEGDSLAIVCTAHGRPPPELSWWQETRLLLDNTSSGTADEAVSRSALRIEALERSHLMARIRCKARSGDQEEEASIALDMNLRPLGVSVAAPARALVAEQPAQFRCDSWGSRPPANLTWWKGSRRMTRSLATVDESSGRTTSVLAFTPGGDDHGRRLRCRAANDRVPGSEIEDALKLEVEFAPSVRLQLAGGSAVNEGGDARFECSVRAHPEPSEPPGWLWEGRPVSTLSGRGAGSGGQHRLESNGSLHILTLLNVQRWQQGRYACLAHNARGKALSAHVILLVRCEFALTDFHHLSAPQEALVF
ncbi:hypothetical protein HPB48_004322 [Haemaphysalis longicornis]|uniref:Ig-like domain-containing protein n=1 Tax=Haemaphysalis longicornis TaxID=44386 RepID=A0A9J6G1H5_HAELO|nr:hypothetical protein HPB48_004322 [Haemaphysalis longicornis]